MDEKVLIVGANGHLGHVVVETDPINKQVLIKKMAEAKGLSKPKV